MSKKEYTKEELMTKEFLSVKQAAIYSEHSIDSIRQWIKFKLIEKYEDPYGIIILLKREDVDKRMTEIKNGERRKKPRGKYKTKKEKINDNTI